MNAILVEDDYQQSAVLRTLLLSTWPHMRVETIQTESEFRQQLASIAKSPPHIIIMDLMLRWAGISREGWLIPIPDDVKVGGSRLAGLRCIELLQKSDATRRIPVILYTIALEIKEEYARFPRNVTLIPKTADPDWLLKVVGSFIAAQVPTSPPFSDQT